MANINAWDSMSLEDDTKDVAEDGKSCGSFLDHFKPRRQINMGAKIGFQTSYSRVKEFRKNMEDLLRENEAMEARRSPSQEYGGGYKRTYQHRREASEDAVVTSGEFSRNRDQPLCCHFGCAEGHGARLCFKLKEDEAQGMARLGGKDLVLPDGKIISYNNSRPIRSVVADYSLKKAEERPVVVKKKDNSSTVSKNSVGRFIC